MKKHAVLAALATLITAGTAQAEHSLLITDVLQPGKVEVQAGYEYSYFKQNLSSGGVIARVKNISSESELQAAVGVAKGLELSLALPYVFSEREIFAMEGDKDHLKWNGIGDLTVGAKYAISDRKEKPYGIVVGLDVKLDTAPTSEGGIGKTAYSPYIAISRQLGHVFTPYVGYRATLRSHDVTDTHTILVGVEHDITKTVEVDFKADVDFFTSAKSSGDASEAYTLDLSAHIEMGRNLYVIPSVAYSVETRYNSDGLTFHTVNGITTGLALYTMF